MIFCYACPDCGIHEEEHQIGRAPVTIFCPICQGICSRAFHAEPKATNPEKLAADGKYPYVSSRLPRNLEGCPTDSKGKPVILSKRHEQEIASRHGMKRE